VSRAFVKEADGETAGDDAPELPVSTLPNRVTPRGLAMLRAELQGLGERRRASLGAADPLAHRPEVSAIERRMRYLGKRIDSAIVEPPRGRPPDRVGFGTTVTVAGEDGGEWSVTIVGEDEADPAAGRISWVSPLARALMGSAVGDEVLWRRPKGDASLEVVAIDDESGKA